LNSGGGGGGRLRRRRRRRRKRRAAAAADDRCDSDISQPAEHARPSSTLRAPPLRDISTTGIIRPDAPRSLTLVDTLFPAFVLAATFFV